MRSPVIRAEHVIIERCGTVARVLYLYPQDSKWSRLDFKRNDSATLAAFDHKGFLG